MKPVYLFIIFFISFYFSSCYYDKEDKIYGTVNCNTPATPSFATDIVPVMSSNCISSGCHNTSSAAAGVVLDTYAGVKQQASNGKLYGSISYSSGYSSMPKGATKLSDCKIQLIKKWIDNGALNN